MNTETQYLVNRSSGENPAWEAARWQGASHVASFHYMRLDGDGAVVIKHTSAIKPALPDATPLEEEIRQLLELPGLVPEARKLITAALQAQASGKTDFAI